MSDATDDMDYANSGLQARFRKIDKELWEKQTKATDPREGTPDLTESYPEGPIEALDKILGTVYRQTSGKGYNTGAGGLSNIHYEDCTYKLKAALVDLINKALKEIGEPLLTDFPTPTPAEHKKMIEVVEWYKARIKELETK